VRRPRDGLSSPPWPRPGRSASGNGAWESRAFPKNPAVRNGIRCGGSRLRPIRYRRFSHGWGWYPKPTRAGRSAPRRRTEDGPLPYPFLRGRLGAMALIEGVMRAMSDWGRGRDQDSRPLGADGSMVRVALIPMASERIPTPYLVASNRSECGLTEVGPSAWSPYPARARKHRHFYQTTFAGSFPRFHNRTRHPARARSVLGPAWPRPA
jgi:hypothetical protein